MRIEELKARKTELGYTNEMIAAKSGVPLGTVQKIFSGATKRPRYNTLQSIQCVLFPEDHSLKEAALYKDIVENLAREWPGGIAEETALDEYFCETSCADHEDQYEKLISRKAPGTFTVKDLKELPDGTMMELIDGVLYDRSWPTKRHQFIVTKLSMLLSIAAEESGHGQCLVLAAPVGVQLNKDDDRNCLLPDLLMVCDEEKYSGGEENIIGAPDLIVEVLSPSTERYDRLVKLNKYWKAGVREYWIINIEDEEVMTYNFGERVILDMYSFEDHIPLGISGGRVVIDFKRILDGLHAYFG